MVPEIDGCQLTHTSGHQRNGTERLGGSRRGGGGERGNGRPLGDRSRLACHHSVREFVRAPTTRRKHGAWRSRQVAPSRPGGGPLNSDRSVGRLRQRRKRLLVRRSPSPPPRPAYTSDRRRPTVDDPPPQPLTIRRHPPSNEQQHHITTAPPPPGANPARPSCGGVRVLFCSRRGMHIFATTAARRFMMRIAPSGWRTLGPAQPPAPHRARDHARRNIIPEDGRSGMPSLFSLFCAHSLLPAPLYCANYYLLLILL